MAYFGGSLDDLSGLDGSFVLGGWCVFSMSSAIESCAKETVGTRTCGFPFSSRLLCYISFSVFARLRDLFGRLPLPCRNSRALPSRGNGQQHCPSRDDGQGLSLGRRFNTVLHKNPRGFC